MNLFSDGPGRVTLIPDAGFPLAVRPQNWPGAQAAKAVITQFSMSAAANVQFLHTLRNFIYVYVFGERLSEMTMGGVAFSNDCTPGAEVGIESLWDYYRQNRVSSAGTPVSIAIGSRLSFDGFLTGFQATAQDPQSGLVQWGMKFVFFPAD